MMKRILDVFYIIAMCILIVGCTSSEANTPTTEPTAIETDESQNDEPIELVVWGVLVENDPEVNVYYQYVKEQYELEHPGVTVTIVNQGWDEALRQNLFNALLAGTPPDIVVGENYFQFFAELGALVPFDDAIADIKDDLIPATYRAAEYQGHVYGLSAFTGVFGFERNCAVVEAAGLDCDEPPETWDELLDHAAMITESGNGDFAGYTLHGPGGFSVGAVFRLAVYLAQVDAALCSDPDCTYPYFNNPKAVQVMEFIRELNAYTPPGLTQETNEGTLYEALFHGLSGYQIAGSWHPTWAKESGCDDCRYSPVPIPENGHSASVVVGNVIYAVLQHSEHPELAIDWVKLLVRPDVQDLIYEHVGRLPSTRGALSRLSQDPNVDAPTKAFVDELLNNDRLVILPQWRKSPNELWRIYNEMLNEILTTDRPVIEIMDEAQAKADEIMQD